MSIIKNQASKWISQADDHYYAGEYAKAIHLYEKALTFDPTNEKAIAYLEKSRQRRADEENRARLPRESIQFYSRARSYLSAGDGKRAIEALKHAMEIAKLAGVDYVDAEILISVIEKEYGKTKVPRVFISYSRNDFGIANEIYLFLRGRGCAPWLDKYELIPGQDWELEIRNNIKASDFFVACLSGNSVSKRGYVQKELKYAISILDEFPEGEIYIIPIRIGECAVPESLASRHWLDWSSPNAKDQLIKAIKSK